MYVYIYIFHSFFWNKKTHTHASRVKAEPTFRETYLYNKGQPYRNTFSQESLEMTSSLYFLVALFLFLIYIFCSFLNNSLHYIPAFDSLPYKYNCIFMTRNIIDKFVTKKRRYILDIFILVISPF